MKKVLTLIFGLIPINVIKVFLLNIIGHSISYKSFIGVSILLVNDLELESRAKIKHFNFIKLDKIFLKKSSFIGNHNIIKGPIDVFLEVKSGISKHNKIRRAYHPITYGKANLKLGKNSFIVSNHFIDLTKSIHIGDNSILAGINSQLWTHGYYHANKGEDRIRIDGEIKIGNNVYVGSRCTFNPGIEIGNSIHLGAGSVVSKDLKESGMYVGQALRHIDNNLDKIKAKLVEVDKEGLIETVYTKN